MVETQTDLLTQLTILQPTIIFQNNKFQQQQGLFAKNHKNKECEKYKDNRGRDLLNETKRPIFDHRSLCAGF